MGPRWGTRRFPGLWPQGRSTESKQEPAQSLFTGQSEGGHGPDSPLEGRETVLRVWTEGRQHRNYQENLRNIYIPGSPLEIQSDWKTAY